MIGPFVLLRISLKDQKHVLSDYFGEVKSFIDEVLILGKGSKKHIWKKYGLLPNRGEGGSARVMKNQTAFLKKVFFREYLESF